jgi:hypothetical protein
MPAPVEFVVMGAMLPGQRVTGPHLRRMSAALLPDAEERTPWCCAPSNTDPVDLSGTVQ